VNIMTKTLYDPEVEKRGIEKGRNMEKIKNAKKLLDVLDDKTISEKLELDESIVKSLREETSNN
ncbi:MAG: hypothetical protein ACI4PU_04800, partial [Intestinibacter sp.]